MKEVVILQKLQRALNQHNLELFLDCFSPDYKSFQPLHPSRAFQGREQVKKNWSVIFNDIADFQSHLIDYEIGAKATWTEWEWRGTKPDGSLMHLRGVIIFGFGHKGIDWARLYMEPVEQEGADINAAIKLMTQ